MAMANMLCAACVRAVGEARSECECVGEDGGVGGARSCGRGGLERREQQQRPELRSAMVVSVTPQVFGFLNCIAFHKH
jgi:hypothetical protein